MGVAGKGEPKPLFHKNAQGERVRAEKNGALGWRLRVRDPKQKGKQPERSFYGSYKEAIKELSKMEETLNRGEMLALSKGPKTIKDAAELWLEAYKWTGRISLEHSGKPNRPFSTWSKAKVQVRTYILPRIGPETRLSALSKRDLDRVLKEMAENGYKQSSINTTVSVMKSLFRDLHRLEITPVNYAENISGNWITNLEKTEDELRIPTTPELIWLSRAMREDWPHHNWIIELLAWTGLRWSELAALEWDDIDWEKKLIKVRRSATESGGRRTVSTTLKTRSSRRNIVLLDRAEETLKLLNEQRLINKAKYPEYNWDRIVNGSRGGYISYKTWQRHLLRARAKTGIDITAHDLRHTFASRLFAKGYDLQKISQQMGHSSIRITEKIYIHLIEHPLNEDADQINAQAWVGEL